MAKKDLRAQMDAARAAAAFIGAAQEADARAEQEEKAAEEKAAAKRTRSQAAGAAEGPSPAADKSASEGGAGAAATTPAPVKGSGEAAAADTPAASKAKRASRQVKSAASDVTMAATVPDFFNEDTVVPLTVPMPDEELLGASSAAVPAPAAEAPAAAKPKATRARKPRKKAADPVPLEMEPANARMTAQVLVPMTAEQREHADLLAQVMKVTRAEVMRQALDEYWENHKSDLQAAVAAYEQLIRKLMK